MSHPVIPLKLDPQTRVCLVGNGPSLLSGHHGALIDEHDEVVRFNRFRIEGFEDHVGRKTTLWSTFGHGYLPGDADVRPDRMIFVYGENGLPAYEPAEIYRIPRAFYNEQWARVKQASKLPDEQVAKLGMSSGFVMALWFLQVVGVQHLTLAGFDHFRKDASPLHHYYNPKVYGRPPELDGDAEALLLHEYKRQSRLNYL